MLGEARYVVVMCGRRWGKTAYGVTEACERLLQGQRVGWFAPTYKYAQEAWREVAQRLRPACKTVSEQEKRLETLTGGVFEVWTLDTADPARGRFYDLVIIDEAGLVRELDTAFWASIRPTLTDRRGRALLLGTPKGRSHAFSQFFAKGEQGADGWRSVRAPTKDNPYIPADEIEEARRSMPPGAFAQEYEGIPADDGANPFGLDAIAAIATLDAPTGGECLAMGWDFARSQDWTVGLGLGRGGEVTHLHRWQAVPWPETRRRVKAYSAVAGLLRGDSTGVGDSVVQELQADGVPLVGEHFSAQNKQKLMTRLVTAIQSRELRIPKDGPLRSELEAFEYHYTQYGVRYQAPEGLHDDCVMALALAVKAWDHHPEKGRAAPPGLPSDQDRHPGFTDGGVRRDQVVARDGAPAGRFVAPRFGTRGGW